jgi:Ca2+-transporting ATPase
MQWHSLTIDETYRETGSRPEGLDDISVQQKLSELGKNELISKKKNSPLLIFLKQFIDVMILVLVVAAIISAIIGEASDTIVIIVIIILNAVIGFVQEYRAEKAMDALRKMAAPSSLVVRNNKNVQVPTADLVPGDIVLIEAGNTVPADLRLCENASIKINEASLTGESNPVDKRTDPLDSNDLPLGDRVNMAYKGTQVIHGHGKGIVVATGMQTELGKIAGMLDKAESVTPLQQRLAQFSKRLTVIVIVLCIIFFFVGYFRGEDINRMLLTAISLAVAAIPEALPAVVTISLALGARRMMKRKVLIRKLYAVETLGSVTYICTDKTGTLTRNEMAVEETWVEDEDKMPILLQAMSLNHTVEIKDGEPVGDPTEIAMVQTAKDQPTLKKIREIPFDSDRKAMTTIHEKDGEYWVITKGATEGLREMIGNEMQKQTILREEERMASAGMRVIGFAGKTLKDMPADDRNIEEFENGLELIGFVGLIDPPRQEAAAAIAECKAAGIVPVMITGDHPLTAKRIAETIGIVESDEHKVITGRELAAFDDARFEAEATRIRVYARVSPDQKLKIVEALQNNGEFVSMTGDGVNDAPSLKKANIGIAMGVTGTDVTKEAAHMILLDDNFSTIVNAVEEGRRIYDNIRKFIKYILTGNAAEIWTIFLAPLLGLPIPLLPVHILWVNLVTDGLPALALAAEKSEKDIMHKPPRRPDESIYAQGLGIHIIWVGLFIGLLTLGTQWYTINHTGDHWQTIVFSVLCFCQLWHVLAIRSEKRSLFKLGLFSNRPLLAAVTGTVLLQLAVIYVPFLNAFFHTQPLSLSELLITFGVSSVVFIVVELEKTVKRSIAGKRKGAGDKH